MADLYSKWVLTNKYAQAEQDAANSGNQITFVRLILSADKFTFADLAGFNDTTLTTINAKQIVPVNYVKTTGSTVSVSTMVTSEGNKADYDANTLLLVASYKGADFLAAAAIAQTPFRITAESDTELLEFTVRPQLTVSNTSAISIAVDLNTPATNERVTDEVASLNSGIEAINNDKTKLWDKIKELVTLKGTQTLDGLFTFTQKIIGRITNADSADLAGKATLLETARKIGGVSFNGGSDIDLPGVNKTGTQNTSGNAASATKLATARKINGVAFDGGGDITVVDSTAYHKNDSPTFDTATVNNLKVSGTETTPAKIVAAAGATGYNVLEFYDGNPTSGSTAQGILGLSSNGSAVFGGGEGVTQFFRDLAQTGAGLGNLSVITTAGEAGILGGDSGVYLIPNMGAYQSGTPDYVKFLLLNPDLSLTRHDGVVLFDKNGIAGSSVDWTNVTPPSGITASTARYKIINGIVYVQITSAYGITGTSGKLLKLPINFRTGSYSIPAFDITNNLGVGVQLATDGSIYLQRQTAGSPAITATTKFDIEFSWPIN